MFDLFEVTVKRFWSFVASSVLLTTGAIGGIALRGAVLPAGAAQSDVQPLWVEVENGDTLTSIARSLAPNCSNAQVSTLATQIRLFNRLSNTTILAGWGLAVNPSDVPSCPVPTTTTAVPTTTVAPTTTTQAPTTTVAPTTTTTTTTLPPTTTIQPPTTTTQPTQIPSCTSGFLAGVGCKGNPGSSQMLVTSSSQQGRSGDGSGNFRFICGLSHIAYDDSILYPGQKGRAHMHQYFGNTGTDENSTHDSLRSSGNGTCSGGIANRSAYWMPTVLKADGTPVLPDFFQVYYKSGYRKVAPSTINEVPHGLVMIAGDANSVVDQDPEYIEWYCTGASRTYTHMVNCGAGKSVQMSVVFPQCWDGEHLDSADHKSHMAYPGYGSNYGDGCPSTHPVAIPVITVTMFYTQPTSSIAGMKISSDKVNTETGAILPGSSLHADYIEGWDPAIKAEYTRFCIREVRDCTRGLGDARTLVDPPGI